MTNYERIKHMSVDEMADFIFGIYDMADDCHDKFINGIILHNYSAESIEEWLESEVKK